MKYNYCIGIDTGVDTGIAVWDRKTRKLTSVKTTSIHRAMETVLKMYKLDNCILVRVEDARQRKWYGENVGKERLKGAGSVERDAKIWEDFLRDWGISFDMVAPKDNKTKMDKNVFKRRTGYAKQTSVHGRDAAMLVFGY